MVLHHVIISILDALVLCLQIGDLVCHRFDLLSKLVIIGSLTTLKVRLLFRYFLKARFYFDFKSLSLLLLCH